MKQFAGQPSLSLLLPSSHVSPALTTPFPHSAGTIVLVVVVVTTVLEVVGNDVVELVDVVVVVAGGWDVEVVEELEVVEEVEVVNDVDVVVDDIDVELVDEVEVVVVDEVEVGGEVVEDTVLEVDVVMEDDDEVEVDDVEIVVVEETEVEVNVDVEVVELVVVARVVVVEATDVEVVEVELVLTVVLVIVVDTNVVVVVEPDGQASPTGRGTHTNVKRSLSLRFLSTPAGWFFFTCAESFTVPLPSSTPSPVSFTGTSRTTTSLHAAPSSWGSSRSTVPLTVFTLADARALSSELAGVQPVTSGSLMQAPTTKVHDPLASVTPSKSQAGSQSLQVTTCFLPSSVTSLGSITS
jgi:hypothetical protein